MHKGRVALGAMDEVVFGRPASEVIVEQMDRLGAASAFLMVSGTLNRETEIIKNIRDVLDHFIRGLKGPAQVREILELAA